MMTTRPEYVYLVSGDSSLTPTTIHWTFSGAHLALEQVLENKEVYSVTTSPDTLKEPEGSWFIFFFFKDKPTSKDSNYVFISRRYVR